MVDETGRDLCGSSVDHIRIVTYRSGEDLMSLVSIYHMDDSFVLQLMHPTCRLDTTYLRLFRTLEEMRYEQILWKWQG